MTLMTKALCTILVTSPTAGTQLKEIATHFHADGIHPMQYKCAECGLEWDANPLTNPRDVTCSNCYSERVILVSVRLSFENWGEQNGGEKEQRARLDRAECELAPALRAAERMAEL